MRKIAYSIATATLVITAMGANAAPNQPIHSAKTFSGTGCGVTDGTTGAQDPDCQWHIMFKPTKEFEPQVFIYQDKGNLQPGQTAPDTTIVLSNTWSDAIGTCQGREVITPSGEYSSYQICRAY